MRNAVSILCLFVLVATNVFAQKSDGDSSCTVDSGFVTVDGGKLFYEVAGKGGNIVLLHDGLIHRAIWDSVFPVLARNHRVVRYDRRGYGRSSNPQAPFSNVDDLNRLLVQLRIDKAIVFGMSAGGGMAIDFTLRYPDKVSALVLVGAVVGGYGYSSHMLTRGGRVSSIAELLSDPQRVIRYFGWEDPYEVYGNNIKAKERCLTLLEANPINVDQAKYRFLKPSDKPALRFLSEVKVPTLVLVGEYDIPDVHAHSGVIEAGIPNAKRDIIRNAGHLVPLEQPEAFNAAVSQFLQRMGFSYTLNSQGVNAAVQYFHKTRESEPDLVLFDESEMNMLGYRFLQDGKIKDAIELFILNTIAYPHSGNVFDSLGEAYLKDDQKELSIKNYEQSLKLNPNNNNAEEMLKQLRSSK